MGGSLFRVIFICLFCLLTGLRVFYKLRAGFLRERLYSREESIAFIVFRSILGVPMLWAVFAYAFAPSRFGWMYVNLPTWLRFVGVLLGAGAIALLFWVHQSLGTNFSTSLAPRKNHTMVESGPYAWVRHPMYSAYFTFFLSVFLISSNWLAGSTGLAIILMLMTVRRIREESLLVERFGERYLRYRQSTGMFLPRPFSLAPGAAGGRSTGGEAHAEPPRRPGGQRRPLSRSTASEERSRNDQKVDRQSGPTQRQVDPRRQGGTPFSCS
jgi:protein-S-isoprenylcysteine O-methyltransferase Ste14